MEVCSCVRVCVRYICRWHLLQCLINFCIQLGLVFKGVSHLLGIKKVGGRQEGGDEGRAAEETIMSESIISYDA